MHIMNMFNVNVCSLVFVMLVSVSVSVSVSVPVFQERKAFGLIHIRFLQIDMRYVHIRTERRAC
jgi:hypothetical protein